MGRRRHDQVGCSPDTSRPAITGSVLATACLTCTSTRPHRALQRQRRRLRYGHHVREAMSQELLAAIEADDTARAAAALDEHGATLIDVLTASGNTALHAAAFAGRAQLCKLFLAARAHRLRDGGICGYP